LNKNIKIGFGVSDVTPPVGTELCGFGKYLERKSTAVLEPLKARALAWECGGKRGAIIGCDLIGVSADITRDVRGILKGEGFDPDSVLVAGTHTHSGPATIHLIAWGEKNPEYLAGLPRRIADAAMQAAADISDASFAYGEAPVSGVSYNRDGGGITDETLKMLKIMKNGRCAGFLYNYSCHPVVMCEATNLISGDFVGLATNALSKKLNAAGIFLQGSLGDQNSVYCHKPQDESVENLKKLSAVFAQAAEAAFANAQPFAADGIAAVRETIDLPHVAPDKIEIIRHLALLNLALGKEEAFDERDRRHLRFEKAGYEEVLACFDRQPPGARPIEIQAVRIGNLYLLCHPFELYYRFHRDFEAALPDAKVFVVGTANDYCGYMPTPDKFELGEGFRYNYAAYGMPIMRGEFRYANHAGSVFVEKMLAMVKGF